MTIPASERQSQLYVGNGLNVRFDFNFRIFYQEDESGIIVRKKLGTEWQTIPESDYVITLNENSEGGHIDFVTAPSTATYFYILGNTPNNQLLDITNYDNFYPDAIERALDKLTAILIEWRQLLDTETQSRILANINYDLLAQSREKELKDYIDSLVASINDDSILGTQFVTSVDSIDILQSLLKWNGRTVFVKSYHPGKDVGGGTFIYDSEKSNINDGGMIINGWVRIVLETVIRPEWFGSPRNGIDDDAEGIRKTLIYSKAKNGIRIYFSKSENINAYWKLASVDPATNSALTVDFNSCVLEFETPNTEMRATVEMDSMIFLRPNYAFNCNGGILEGSKLVNYCIKSDASGYNPKLSIKNTTFQGANIASAYLQTYIAELLLCSFNQSPTGIIISGTPGNIITSISMVSCYARDNDNFGYDLGLACYCSLVSCACDNMPNGTAYRIRSYGGAMIGCGAENVKKLAQFDVFRGFTISSFYAQRAGSLNVNEPTPYLIEFVTGTNATLSGLYIHPSSVRYYQYKVGLTGSSYGSECLNVLDNSVTRSQAYFVPNFNFPRPIKFQFGDATQKNITVSKTVDELPAYFKEIESMRIDHDLVIQLADGTQQNQSSVQKLSKLTGCGSLTIQGNATDRTLVKLHAGSRLLISDCSCRVVFKDLTLENRTVSTNSHLQQVENCRDLVNDNVLFSTAVNAGSAIYASKQSRITLNNGSIAINSGGSFTNVYQALAGSRIDYEKLNALPSGGAWNVGFKIENSNPTSHVGWVYSSTGWKTYGAIS
ncbi:hypothetical protein WCE00_10570 [Acinetobacter haemolyticus]|uniref:hypothetical protein n=1 Tax=Acinetobacter haemolyticus TaxID=29430 RepID=UPI0034D589CD